MDLEYEISQTQGAIDKVAENTKDSLSYLTSIKSSLESIEKSTGRNQEFSFEQLLIAIQESNTRLKKISDEQITGWKIVALCVGIGVALLIERIFFP